MARQAEANEDLADGRKTRSLRTREAVVAAVIALQEKDVLRPTAQQIAKKAGVSVRSIFQHFPSQESLTEAVMDRLGVEMFGDLHAATPAGALPERIREFTRKRAMLLDRLVLHRRAAAVYAPAMTHRILRRRERVRTLLRGEVAAVFGPELNALKPGPSKRLLQALVSVYEAELWDSLRRGQQLSSTDSRELLEQLVWGQLLFHFGPAVRPA